MKSFARVFTKFVYYILSYTKNTNRTRKTQKFRSLWYQLLFKDLTYYRNVRKESYFLKMNLKKFNFNVSILEFQGCIFVILRNSCGSIHPTLCQMRSLFNEIFLKMNPESYCSVYLFCLKIRTFIQSCNLICKKIHEDEKDYLGSDLFK